MDFFLWSADRNLNLTLMRDLVREGIQPVYTMVEKLLLTADSG